jgi:parallel beta-helix repeat protein
MAERLETRRLLTTYTVNASGGGANYTDLETAIVSVAAGSTLLVSPGTYTAHGTSIDPSQSIFWINKALTIQSVSGGVTLVSPAGQPENLLISSSNVRVQGVSLQGGSFCVDVQDFLTNTTLSNVVLKNLTLAPDADGTSGGNGHGILLDKVTNSIVDGCTVGLSYANGIFIDDSSSYDIVENCTVNGTVTQHAIAVKNSTFNQVLNNTVTASSSDGIILLNASNNRVTGNNISGHKVDGICLTNTSDFNYVALNTIVSNGWVAGRTDGTGIWMNDESDGNTIFANTTSGSPECGIDVFVSSNNLIDGNNVFGNYEGGIFIFDCVGYPLSTGNIPANTTIINNDIHGNATNSGVILRGAVNSDVERNYISGSYSGTYGSSTDGGISAERTTNAKIIGNTLQNLQTGFYIFNTSTGVSVYHNRIINAGENYALTGAGASFDDSVTIGGNYWSSQAAAGNPSTTTPYTNFVYDVRGDRGGGFIDNYPFQTETLGLPYAITVTSPAAGTSVAPSSTRAIQWTSSGSVLVNIYYTSSGTGDVLIAGNQPDTGVYSWKVPSLPAASDYSIKIVPENSAGQVQGSAFNSGTFSSAGTNNLVLLSPGADMTAAPGASMRVAWQLQTSGTGVDVQIQTNGGSWSTLASNVTDDWADVTLPNTMTSSARIRILNHVSGVGDTQDGLFRIGTTAAINSVTNLQIGTNQTISWISPAGSDTVDVQYWNGVSWLSIATELPDIGHLSWFVPEMFTNGAQVRIQYQNSADSQITTSSSNTFNINYTLATGTEVQSYRLYNNGTKEHLYTTDLNEYNVLGGQGWSQEGPAYKVYNGPATVSGVNAIPEYRLYNPGSFQHLWTTDRNEYFTLRTTGAWHPEGVAAYMFPSAVTSSTPLYRLSYNGSTLLHLWTTDLNEYNTLPGSGWVQESIIGYVLQ